MTIAGTLPRRYTSPMRKPALAALLLVSALQAFAQAPPPPPPDASQDEGFSGDWPRTLQIGAGVLEIFQPQVEKFEGVTMAGRSAVSWSEKGGAPVFGVLWFTTTSSIDRDARTATVETIRVDRVRFPNITREEERQLATILEAEVPKWDLTVGLDAIQASLAVSQAEKRSSEGLRSTPPKMRFSNVPAVLLLYAGKPVEQPIPGSSLRRAVNTPMFVVEDPATRRWYLSGGKFWYEAQAATGPFAPVAAPSPAVKQFFDAHPPPADRAGDDAARKDAGRELEEPDDPAGGARGHRADRALRLRRAAPVRPGRRATPTCSTPRTPSATCWSTFPPARPTCWPPGAGSGEVALRAVDLRPPRPAARRASRASRPTRRWARSGPSWPAPTRPRTRWPTARSPRPPR